MYKKQLLGKWSERIMVFLPLFLSGCVTLAKSQENFARQMNGKEAPAAAIAFIHAPLAAYAIFFLGLAVSAFGGHFIILPYLQRVKRYLNVKAKSSDQTVLIGCIERAVYTTSFIVDWYGVIIILFGLKTGKLAIACLDLDIKKTGKIVISYMFGNILSLGIAILAGVVILRMLLLKF